MLSKRSTLVAITVMAALSIEVGCGDGSHKTTVRKSLTPAAGAAATTQKPMWNADGSPMIDPATGKQKTQTVPANQAGTPTAPGTTKTNPDGTTTKTNADGTTTTFDANGKDASGKAVPKSLAVQGDKNLDVIAKREQQELSGTAVTRDTLDAGTYDLQSVMSSTHILNQAEETRAIQNSNLQANGAGFMLQSSDTLSAGTISTFVDTNPRRVDVATSFKVDLSGGKWMPNRDQAANVTVQDTVTTADGKAKMNDALDNAEVNPASILGMIATGELQKDNSYRATDSTGAVMYLRLFKTASQLKVAMSFEEQRAAQKGTQNVSMDRNLFFTYKITADPNGGKPAPADNINVTQLPPGQSLTPPPSQDSPTAPAVPATN